MSINVENTLLKSVMFVSCIEQEADNVTVMNDGVEDHKKCLFLAIITLVI